MYDFCFVVQLSFSIVLAHSNSTFIFWFVWPGLALYKILQNACNLVVQLNEAIFFH